VTTAVAAQRVVRRSYCAAHRPTLRWLAMPTLKTWRMGVRMGLCTEALEPIRPLTRMGGGLKIVRSVALGE